MTERIWACKIGGEIPDELAPGVDSPMRAAVEKAFKEITGVDATFNFSGWDGALTEVERSVLLGSKDPKPLMAVRKGGPAIGRLDQLRRGGPITGRMDQLRKD